MKHIYLTILLKILLIPNCLAGGKNEDINPDYPPPAKKMRLISPDDYEEEQARQAPARIPKDKCLSLIQKGTRYFIPDTYRRGGYILSIPSIETIKFIEQFQTSSLTVKPSAIHGTGAFLKKGRKILETGQVIGFYTGHQIRMRKLKAPEMRTWHLWEGRTKMPTKWTACHVTQEGNQLCTRLPQFMAVNEYIYYTVGKNEIILGIDSIDSPAPVSKINCSIEASNIIMLPCFNPDWVIRVTIKGSLEVDQNIPHDAYRLLVVALRTIRPGKELLMDYTADSGFPDFNKPVRDIFFTDNHRDSAFDLNQWEMKLEKSKRAPEADTIADVEVKKIILPPLEPLPFKGKKKYLSVKEKNLLVSHLRHFYIDPANQSFNFMNIIRHLPKSPGQTSWSDEELLTLDLNFLEIDPSPFETCTWPLSQDQIRALNLLIKAGNKAALNLKIKLELLNDSGGLQHLETKLLTIKKNLTLFTEKTINIPVRAEEIRTYIRENFDSEAAGQLLELASHDRLILQHEHDENPWQALPYKWENLAQLVFKRWLEGDKDISALAEKQICNLVHYRLKNVDIDFGIPSIMKCAENISKTLIIKLCLSVPFDDYYLSKKPYSASVFLIISYLNSLESEAATPEDIDLIYSHLQSTEQTTKKTTYRKEDTNFKMNQIAKKMFLLINPDNKKLINHPLFNLSCLKPLIKNRLVTAEHIISLILNDPRCSTYNDRHSLVQHKLQRRLRTLGVPDEESTIESITAHLEKTDLPCKVDEAIRTSPSATNSQGKLSREDVCKLRKNLREAYPAHLDDAHLYLEKLFIHWLSAGDNIIENLLSLKINPGIILGSDKPSRWGSEAICYYIIQHDIHGIMMKGFGPIEIWLLGKAAYLINTGKLKSLDNTILKNYMESGLNMPFSNEIFPDILWTFIKNRASNHLSEACFFKFFAIPAVKVSWLTPDQFFELAAHSNSLVDYSGVHRRSSKFNAYLAEKMRHIPEPFFSNFSSCDLASFITENPVRKEIYDQALVKWKRGHTATTLSCDDKYIATRKKDDLEFITKSKRKRSLKQSTHLPFEKKLRLANTTHQNLSTSQDDNDPCIYNNAQDNTNDSESSQSSVTDNEDPCYIPDSEDDIFLLTEKSLKEKDHTTTEDNYDSSYYGTLDNTSDDESNLLPDTKIQKSNYKHTSEDHTTFSNVFIKEKIQELPPLPFHRCKKPLSPEKKTHKLALKPFLY